ncbi:piggyBac transposable element-derived protein 1-like [Marmota marmota marmota]|uniref:piggyBac transposable element-derived protein 1-like n=1 Tax=Marmota marmota marmota TaxID=9994 RepID=UPI00209284E3|nr:piggyBac transposable element-derived protein 1-like [Marmota marmota marmota]
MAVNWPDDGSHSTDFVEPGKSALSLILSLSNSAVDKIPIFFTFKKQKGNGMPSVFLAQGLGWMPGPPGGQNGGCNQDGSSHSKLDSNTLILNSVQTREAVRGANQKCGPEAGRIGEGKPRRQAHRLLSEEPEKNEESKAEQVSTSSNEFPRVNDKDNDFSLFHDKLLLAAKSKERECAPHISCSSSVPTKKTVSNLNTLKDRHPPCDSWARMHIASLQYAAGDITRKGRKKDKAGVSELLQGLAFSDDSEVEEDEPEAQPQKKLKVSSVPEKSWTKRDIKPNFPSWSALDSGLLNLKSEKLNPVELFELFFDDETFNLIVNETINYASQKNVNLEVTVQEMRCVFGVLLWSGFVRRPRRGMYWEISDADQNLVRDAIRRDRFELIFSYLHFADNSHLDQKDKFSKLRPLIKQMNKNFLLYAPLEE